MALCHDSTGVLDLIQARSVEQVVQSAVEMTQDAQAAGHDERRREQGTFIAAAASLGYTQSAVSRQIAAIDQAAGADLLERRRGGVRLSPAGSLCAARRPSSMRSTQPARELSGLPGQAGTVRLGWFLSAGAFLLPRALAALRHTDPGLHVVGREGSIPSLVRLRAGSPDLALT